MHEFRPASVVRADAELAAALPDGAAVQELIDRFGPPLTAHAVELCDGDIDAADALTAQALGLATTSAESYEADRGFAPWLSGLVERVAGRSLDPGDVERIWTVRLALRDLRSVGDGDDVLGSLDHDDRERLRRRVEHVLDGRELDQVLAERWVRVQPAADLADRVLGSLRQVDDRDTGDGPAVNESSGGTTRLGRSVRPLALGVGAAIAALFVGIVLLSAISGNPAPVDVEAEFTPTGAIDGVEGTVQITEVDAGLRIELSVVSLPPRPTGRYYAVVLTLDDGSSLDAGTFTEGAELALSAGTRLDRVVELDVVETASDAGDSASVVLKLDVAAELAR